MSLALLPIIRLGYFRPRKLTAFTLMARIGLLLLMSLEFVVGFPAIVYNGISYINLIIYGDDATTVGIDEGSTTERRLA